MVRIIFTAKLLWTVDTGGNPVIYCHDTILRTNFEYSKKFKRTQWESRNQYDIGMEFPIRLKLLIQLKACMNQEQLKKLDAAIASGEIKTTRFTAEEFRDLVNKFVMHRMARRLKGL